MKEELDLFLVKRFPDIFKDRYGNIKETSMSWGFECGDGWFKLLYNACSLIESHINHIKSQNEFKLKTLNQIKSGETVTSWQLEQYNTNKLIVQELPLIVAKQVKEKFGTLRFYYDGGDEYISGVISMAENMSATTCEVCGDVGRLTTEGWHKVVCEKHGLKKEELKALSVNDKISGLMIGSKSYFVITQVLDEKTVKAKKVISKWNDENISSDSDKEYTLEKVTVDDFSYFNVLEN